MTTKKTEKRYMAIDGEQAIVCEGPLDTIKEEIGAMFMDGDLVEEDLKELRIVEVIDTHIDVTKGPVVIFSDERK